jgi:hypothetical protein
VRQKSGDGSNTYSKVDFPNVSPIVVDAISVSESSISERVAPVSLQRHPFGSLEFSHQRLRMVMVLTGKLFPRSTSIQELESLVWENVFEFPSIALNAQNTLQIWSRMLKTEWLSYQLQCWYQLKTRRLQVQRSELFCPYLPDAT